VHASPIRLVYDALDGGRRIRVDHIFWAVVSIAILGVLMSLLLRMLIQDFLAGPSSGRRRPKLKS
jgi:ABC-type nitrate/sulfonate/bicarbonate transport system permease component